MKIFFFLAFALLALPARAQLPGPTGFSFLKGAKFTVAGYTNANGTTRSALTGFPVLVRIAEDSPVGFSYADLTSSTGDDLCFIDMDGTGLPFEIDTWDAQGTSLVWVRLPSMTNGAEFVMCWGGGTIGKTVCSESPFSGYVGVWHMKEASGTVSDSSGNGFAATPSGPAAATDCVAVSGPVGNGRQCSTALGANNLSYLSVPSYDNSKPVGDTFAVSGWFDIGSGQTGSDNDARFFSRKENYQNGHGWEVIWKTSKEIRVRGAASGDNIKVQNLDYAGKGWKHFFIVYDGKNSVFYENGVQKGAKTNGTAATENGRPLAIGGYANDNGSQLLGSVDECRLLDAVPGADWVWAEYASMADAAFLSSGEAQSYSGILPPSVGIVVTDRQYTNVSFTVSVGSIGTGAGSADVWAKFAATDDFASPLWSTNYTVSDVDAQTVSLVGLATGTTYYVQARIVNDQNVTNTSPAVAITTLSPGAPAGTATFVERGFTTMEATGTTTAFGTGAQSATMFLQASTSTNFATVVSGAGVVAALNEQTPLSVSGLEPGANYNLRVCISNDWGLQTFVELPPAAARDVPFAVTGIGWTFAPDGETVDVTFGVSGVYDGASGTATLYFGKTPNPTAYQGAQSFSASATLEWTRLAFEADPMYAKVVLSATLNGQTFSNVYTARIAAGSTAVAVSDVSAHMSAATAVRVHAGDVVTLPETTGDAHYFVGNKLFGSLDGNVLTALRPGILGVHCVGNDGATNTMAVLVLPEKIGNGDIYIFKETSISGNNNGLWCNAGSWDKVGADTNDSWPQNQDDIAIVPFYSLEAKSVNLGGDATVGALYVGGFRDTKANITLGTNNSGYKRAISFRRTDGGSVIVQLCSNSLHLGNEQARTLLTLSGGLRLVDFLSDTVLSGGWDGSNSTFPQGRFTFSSVTNRIGDGVTVELREMDTQGVSYNSGTLSLGNLAGSGTFWNHSSGLVKYAGDSSLFAGLVRDSGGHNAGGESQGRSGPAYFRSITFTNACAETAGWVGSNGQDAQSDYKKGVGTLYTGYPHFHEVDKPHLSYFPARGATMHGGYIINRYIGSTAWTESAENSITRDVKRTAFLKVDCGFNYLRGDAGSAANPGNDFIADALVHTNKATLRIDDTSRFSLASSVDPPLQTTVIHGVSSFAFGAGGDPEATAAYSVVPWMAGPVAQNDQTVMFFACFDDNDRLVRPAYESKALASWGDADNAVVWSSGKNSIALAADKTVNSLVLDNSGLSSADKRLGAGRTLSISSGGLVFTKSGAVVGTEGSEAANGFLDLGDAARPAYVWARGSASSPNQIWAPVTAPGGFVAAYTGNLVLGGDQTGIAEELVVNAGTLQLGTASSPCRLAKNLPIRIFANATLKLPNAGSVSGRILRFDGSAGWFGKVEIADGVAASCKKAFFRDYPETPEWQPLERGFYGSSDSGVEALATVTHPAFVRDDLFTGTGTLKVVSDDRIPPTVMILR